MKRKIAALLLVLSLSFAALIACGGNDADNGNNIDINGNDDVDITGENGYNGAGGDVAPSHWDILGERDFEGVTFRILDANDNPAMWHNVPEETFTGEAVNDALIARNAYIEERFNVVIEYEQVIGHSNQGTNILRNSIRAGEATYDMIIGKVMAGDLAMLATEGMLQNMAALPYLSLQSPWWSRLMYQNLQFDGRLFFTMGDIVPSMYQAPAAMFFNTQMMQDYGVTENLYELVLNGQWTLDALERITRDVYQDVNQDGQMTLEDDIFGVILADAVLTSNKVAAAVGINLSTFRDNTIAIDFAEQHVLERVSRLGEVFHTPRYPPHRPFLENRAMFLVHWVESGIHQLRAMEQDFGIVPLPKFNEQQESYVSFINPWNCAFVGVPLTANSERSGFMMEALAYSSYRMVRHAAYDIVLHHRAARDEESARMIDIIIETSYLDLNGIYNWGNSTGILNRAIFFNDPLVSAIEAASGAIESAIQGYIDAIMSH